MWTDVIEIMIYEGKDEKQKSANNNNKEKNNEARPQIITIPWVIKLAPNGGTDDKERHAKGNGSLNHWGNSRINIDAIRIVPHSVHAKASNWLNRLAQGALFPDKREATV